jgi:hypothetical protein
MHSGKLVKSAGITKGKSGVWLSTFMRTLKPLSLRSSAKPGFVPYFAPFFTQYLSPLKIASSPLIEHYFYPVSTGPINRPNQRKLKKGSK